MAGSDTELSIVISGRVHRGTIFNIQVKVIPRI